MTCTCDVFLCPTVRHVLSGTFYTLCILPASVRGVFQYHGKQYCFQPISSKLELFSVVIGQQSNKIKFYFKSTKNILTKGLLLHIRWKILNLNRHHQIVHHSTFNYLNTQGLTFMQSSNDQKLPHMGINIRAFLIQQEYYI